MELLRTFDIGENQGASHQDDRVDSIKKVLRNLSLAGTQVRADSSLAEHLEAIAKDKEGRRNAALFVLRVIGTKGLIPPTAELGKHFELRVVSLVELALPDICKQFQLADDKQTIEKHDILATVHSTVMSKVEIFSQFPTEGFRIQLAATRSFSSF